MPHYGKHKRRSELVQAHIREDGSVSCGRCGQFLWSIDGERLSSADVSFHPGFAGRRLEGDGVWRLTRRTQTNRRRAEVGLSTRTVSDHSARILKIRLSRNLFRQEDMDVAWAREHYLPARLYDALNLPAKVECARWRDVNIVEVP